MSKFLTMLDECFIPNEYDSVAKANHMAQMKICFDDIKSDIKDEMVSLGEKYEINLLIDDRQDEESCYYETDKFHIYIRFAEDKYVQNIDGFEHIEFDNYFDEREEGSSYEMVWKMVEDHCQDLIPSVTINRIRKNDEYYYSRYMDLDQSERTKSLIEKWKVDNKKLEESIKAQKKKELENRKAEIEKQLKEMEA